MKNSEIITQAISNIGNRSTGKIGGLATSDFFKQHLRIFYNQTAAYFNHPSYDRDVTVTTVASTADYTLSTERMKTFLSGEVFENSTWVATLKRDKRSSTERHSTVNTGHPASYILFQNKLRLVPIPDGVYTVKCSISIWPDYDVDTNYNSDNPLGEEWDCCAIYFLAYTAFLALQQSDDAQIQYVQYLNQLNLMQSTSKDLFSYNPIENVSKSVKVR